MVTLQNIEGWATSEFFAGRNDMCDMLQSLEIDWRPLTRLCWVVLDQEKYASVGGLVCL